MKLFNVLLMLVLIMVMVIGCSSGGESTANDLVTGLKDEDLPIGEIMIYRADNDPNEMLGRPNQYISKVNFEDTRVEQVVDGDLAGGSIEVFSNGEDLTTRVNYLKSVFEQYPVFTEYLYIKGNYLLRLNASLTPEQAEQYEVVFNKLK
ncbi:MAG: hypothetical protein K9L62_02120 [Vallitaleaceae bacterium]|nr:hypothetical protein [Vallitaleaceae bacterium]